MLVCSAGVLTSGLALLRGSWWRCADLDFPCLSLLHGWVPAPSFPRRSPLFFRPSVAITFARPVAVRRGARRPHQPAFTTMCSSNISSTRTLSPRTAATRTRPGLSSRGGGLWGSLPSKRWRWVCGCGLLGRSDMGGGPLGPFFSPLFFLFFFFCPWSFGARVLCCSDRDRSVAPVTMACAVYAATSFPRRRPRSHSCCTPDRFLRLVSMEDVLPGPIKGSRTWGPLPLVDLTTTAVWHTLSPSRGLPVGRRQR